MQSTVHVFSFRGSGRWPFPEDSGHLGRRSSVYPTWSISPGSIFLEDSESVCFDIFLLLLHGLFFSLAFCFRVHASFSASTFFFLRFFFYGTCTHVHNTMTHFQQEEYQPADRKVLTKKKIPTPRAPASPQGQVSLAG